MVYQHSQPSPCPPTGENVKSFLGPDKRPPRAARVSKHKWFRLLGLLRSGVPTISGAAVMFIRLQHALKTSDNRRVLLTPKVHDDLNLCRYIIASLASRPTCLGGIKPHPTTWKGPTDASLEGMRGVCQIPIIQWFVWSLPLGANTV